MSAAPASFGVPPLVIDAIHALRLLGLGLEAEARRILADHVGDLHAIETIAMIDDGQPRQAARRLAAIAAGISLG